jgi:hypothetical protein
MCRTWRSGNMPALGERRMGGGGISEIGEDVKGEM